MAAILQPRVSRNGPERFVLALALFMPLAVMSLAIAQLSGMNLTLSTAPRAPPTLHLLQRPPRW